MMTTTTMIINTLNNPRGSRQISMQAWLPGSLLRGNKYLAGENFFVRRFFIKITEKETETQMFLFSSFRFFFICFSLSVFKVLF